MKKNFIVTLLFTAVVSTSLQAETFDALRYETIGIDALSYKKRSDFSAVTNTVMVDAEIDSLGTQSVTYDRTLFNQSRVGGNYVLSSKLGVRYFLQAQLAMRVQEGKEEPREITREQWTEGRPRIELTMLGENGIELFAGASYFIISGYERNTVSSTVETSWRFDPVTMPIPHVGIVKRAAAFEGGFIYKLGAEKSRKLSKRTTGLTDESFEFSDKVHEPSEMGLFAAMNLGFHRAVMEFTAVSAGEGGTLTDNGDSVAEDYMRLRLEMMMPNFTIPMNVALIHRTLSYADNRNVTVDMIPMTAVHWRFVFGTLEQNMHLGLILGYGYDKQSIPEFNANYKVGAYGLSAGLVHSF